MTDIFAGQHSENFFGKPVLDFLSRAADIGADGKLVVATPMDCNSRRDTPEVQLKFKTNVEEAMHKAGVVSYNANSAGVCIASRDVGSSAGNYRNSAGGESSVIILSEEQTYSTEASFRKLADLPSGIELKNIPGTVQDWRAAILFHETTHVENGDTALNNVKTDLTIAKEELRADAGAVRKYEAAFKEGAVSNPDVMTAVASARAMSNVLSPSMRADPHDLAVFVGHPVADKINNASSMGPINQAYQEILEVRSQIQIGTLQRENPRQYELIRAQAIGDLSMAGKITISQSHMDSLGSAYSAAESQKSPATTQNLKSLLNAVEVPNDANGLLEKRIAELSASHMSENMSQYGPGILASAKEMQNAPSMTNKPFATALLDRFVEGAEKYAPDVFKKLENERGYAVAGPDQSGSRASGPSLQDIGPMQFTLNQAEPTNRTAPAAKGPGISTPGL